MTEHRSDLQGTYPAVGGVALTADAANDLDKTPTRGLYVGTGGDIIVDFYDGDSSVTLKNVPSGTVLPIQINRLRQGIDCVALY
jgi:hypothetical protein